MCVKWSWWARPWPSMIDSWCICVWCRQLDYNNLSHVHSGFLFGLETLQHLWVAVVQLSVSVCVYTEHKSICFWVTIVQLAFYIFWFATDVESCYLYKEGYVFVLFWFVCWFVCVTDWLIEKLINCPMTQSQAANFSSVITLSDQQLSNQTFYFIIHLRLVPVFKRLTLR